MKLIDGEEMVFCIFIIWTKVFKVIHGIVITSIYVSCIINYEVIIINHFITLIFHI